MFMVLDLYHALFIDRIKKKEKFTSHVSVSIMDTLRYIKAFARVQDGLCHVYSQAQYILSPFQIISHFENLEESKFFQI